MNKCLGLFIITFFLFACTPWPRPSTGGYALYYLFTPCYQQTLTRSPDLMYLSMQLARVRGKMRPICSSNIARCFPARIKLLRDIDGQIAQEIARGLVMGASMDLGIYEGNINELLKLQRFKGCPKPSKTNSRSWAQLKMRLE